MIAQARCGAAMGGRVVRRDGTAAGAFRDTMKASDVVPAFPSVTEPSAMPIYPTIDATKRRAEHAFDRSS